jgi:serine/threonine protein phosphatase PrpC
MSKRQRTSNMAIIPETSSIDTQSVTELPLYSAMQQQQQLSMGSIEFDGWLKVSIAESKGSHRSVMEDRIVTQSFTIDGESWYILCVLDGHGGADTADDIAGRLLLYIRSSVTSDCPGTTGLSIPLEAVPEALKEVFILLNDSVSYCTESGSTMTLLLFVRKAEKVHGWSAHVGDSEALQVSTSKHTMQVLTPKHRPFEPNEKKRLEDHFPDIVVEQTNRLRSPNRRMSLAVSRAIGDVMMGPAVTAEPEITTLTFTCNENSPDLFVIASDGLWDKVKPSTVGKMCLNTSTLLLGQKWRTCAGTLCAWRNNTFTQHDNTSIIMALVYPMRYS